MADFTTLKAQINSGASDASPTWSDIAFGTTGNELRSALSGGIQTTTTGSAAWPSIAKPASGSTLINALYAFSADTTGFLVTGADGTGAHFNVFRISWDNLGTFAAACTLSAHASNTFPAASPGSQPTVGDGTSLVNGTTESSNRSLIKATVYGNGITAAGAADNPSSNMSSNPTVTSGSTGAVTSVNATWTAWQDLQANSDWLANGAISKALTAGTWNFLLAVYLTASMTGGVLIPGLTFGYSWI